jgi:hypothetical protein
MTPFEKQPVNNAAPNKGINRTRNQLALTLVVACAPVMPGVSPSVGDCYAPNFAQT